jgi:hypothetical protein
MAKHPPLMLDNAPVARGPVLTKTLSVELAHPADSLKQPSVDSAAPPPPKLHKPQELGLIPFLLAKGHFEETERLVRAALGLPNVNEGEGLGLLLRVLALQAEMYKEMGLWPLAVGVCMDCVDLAASLLGYDDDESRAAICATTSTLRKMRCPNLAKRYVEGICSQLTQVAMNTLEKGPMAALIVDQDRKALEKITNDDAVWDTLRKRCPRGKGASDSRRRRLWHMAGLGSLWVMLWSSQGHAVAARSAFVAYCETVSRTTTRQIAAKAQHKQKQQERKERGLVDPFDAPGAPEPTAEEQALRAMLEGPPADHTLCRLEGHCHFVILCFRLRTTGSDDTFRYLCQMLIQKYVSYSRIKTLDVAAQFWANTPSFHTDKIDQFVHYGIPFGKEVFDRQLEASILELEVPYRRWLLSPSGALMRTGCLQVDAELLHMHATLIQTEFRRGRAVARIDHVRRQRDEERENKLRASKGLAARSPGRR